jgi:transposase
MCHQGQSGRLITETYAPWGTKPFGTQNCDNLKAGVAKALWFEPTLNRTFAAMAEHYDTTILPTRSRKPRDKGKVEGAVLIVERWILARLRNQRFFSLADLNAAIALLLEDLNNRPMRHLGKSRRQVFEEIERAALASLPSAPFEYAEWKTAKVHPDYHVEVDKTFYSVPHRLIGRRVEVRLTSRLVEIFQDHQRVASHVRRSQRGGHVTVNEHMPKAHQRYANMTPASLIKKPGRLGPNVAILIERMMRERPHPEQGYRSAMGVIALARRYEPARLEAACERALAINAISYASVNAILKSGLDRARGGIEPVKATPMHANIRGGTYYQ